jgi:hypothetical protein
MKVSSQEEKWDMLVRKQPGRGLLFSRKLQSLTEIQVWVQLESVGLGIHDSPSAAALGMHKGPSRNLSTSSDWKFSCQYPTFKFYEVQNNDNCFII